MTTPYKVYLADDERMIREGIAALIPWNRLGLEFMGAAPDGLVAYEEIVRIQPDIVITDIKMPKLDGLKLIERLRKELPDTRFIVLSGYGEFEFASKAMQHGVRHYVLKPCNEDEIIHVLDEVIVELQEQRSQGQLLATMKQQLAETRSEGLEPFLRDSLLNRPYGREELERYRFLLRLDGEADKVRLLVFTLEEPREYAELQALRQSLEAAESERGQLLATVAENPFVLIVRDTEQASLLRWAGELQTWLQQRLAGQVTLALSAGGRLEELASMYKEIQVLLGHQFYMGNGRVMTSASIPKDRQVKGIEPSELPYDAIVMAVKIGDVPELHKQMDGFFRTLYEVQCDIHTARSFCIELMTRLVGVPSVEPGPEPSRSIVPMLGMRTLHEIYLYIEKEAAAAAQLQAAASPHKRNKLILRMKQLMNDHLAHEELSLQWLAKTYFYMNADYLGKQFRKETGEKFSHYLSRIRIERSKELMAARPDAKIYEIAEQTGFGKDAQYFGNVFKKHTGYSPMEYKKIIPPMNELY